VDKFKTQYYLEAKEKNSISFKSQIIASLIRSHFIISLHNKNCIQSEAEKNISFGYKIIHRTVDVDFFYFPVCLADAIPLEIY
jgi:hypothetical protein